MFDVDAARQAGRTDEQIMSHLSSQYDFNTDAALKAGKTPDQIISHLANTGQATMSYLQAKGWTKEQSAGIVGNLHVESDGMKPFVNEYGKSEGKGGFGFAQWTGSRRAELFKRAEEKGEKQPSIRTQLDFLHEELNGSEKKAGDELRKANNPKMAAMAFSYGYERPGKPLIEQRIKHAEEYYSGKTPEKKSAKSGRFSIRERMDQAAKAEDIQPTSLDYSPDSQPRPSAKDIAPVTDQVLPLVGAAGGALAASPGGPVAMVAGGGLGYAGGKQAARYVREAAGETPRRGWEPVLEAGKDVIEGAIYSAAGPEAGTLKQIAGAGLTYSAAQELDKAYRIAKDETKPKEMRAEAMDAVKQIMEGSAFAGAFHAAINIPEAGPYIRKGLKAGAERLSESALKIPANVPESERRAIIDAQLGRKGERGYLPTQKGNEALRADIAAETERKHAIIDDLTKSGKRVNKEDAIAEIDKTIESYRSLPPDRAKDFIEPLEELKAKYQSGEAIITPEQAQNLKEIIYKLHEGSYGDDAIKKAGVRGEKDIARGVKELLEQLHPELKELNAKTSAKIKLSEELEKASHRIRNLGVLDFKTLGAGVVGHAIAGTRGLEIAVATAKILDDPVIKSRLAIALDKASRMGEKPPVNPRDSVPVGKWRNAPVPQEQKLLPPGQGFIFGSERNAYSPEMAERLKPPPKALPAPDLNKPPVPPAKDQLRIKESEIEASNLPQAEKEALIAELRASAKPAGPSKAPGRIAQEQKRARAELDPKPPEPTAQEFKVGRGGKLYLAAAGEKIETPKLVEAAKVEPVKKEPEIAKIAATPEAPKAETLKEKVIPKVEKVVDKKVETPKKEVKVKAVKKSEQTKEGEPMWKTGKDAMKEADPKNIIVDPKTGETNHERSVSFDESPKKEVDAKKAANAPKLSFKDQKETLLKQVDEALEKSESNLELNEQRKELARMRSTERNRRNYKTEIDELSKTVQKTVKANSVTFKVGTVEYKISNDKESLTRFKKAMESKYPVSEKIQAPKIKQASFISRNKPYYISTGENGFSTKLVSGSPVKIPGYENIDLFIHKEMHGKDAVWTITDTKSGVSVYRYKGTRENALRYAKGQLDSIENVRDTLKENQEKIRKLNKGADVN